MATIQLPRDFKEFLQLLNAREVSYLLIGGFAVGVYGFLRATGDMDVWVRRDADNAKRVEAALRDFGFGVRELCAEVFLEPSAIVRMGVPPLRLDILNTISGVDFDTCYERRVVAEIEGVSVPVISLDDLKENKRASGRDKDLIDLRRLP